MAGMTPWLVAAARHLCSDICEVRSACARYTLGVMRSSDVPLVGIWSGISMSTLGAEAQLRAIAGEGEGEPGPFDPDDESTWRPQVL